MNPSLLRASFAIGSVLLGGALLVSGCGGGGGGPASPTATPGPSPTPTATATPTPVQVAALNDEFNSSSLDRSKWTVLDSSNTLQRTEFGNQPTFPQGDADGTKFMRVPMDSYLPDDSARTTGILQFYGTEIVSTQKIARGSGIEFQARMRMNNPKQGGMVASFFMFGQKGNFGGTPPLSFDEIDHELLTNGYLNSVQPYTWTNDYNDFRIPQTGVPSGDRYDDTTKTLGEAEPLTTGYLTGGWNVYRIVWQAGQVQWFINDHLIRTDTSGRVPDDPLGVRFNIWAATSPPNGWAAAFDDTLKPAKVPADNQTYSVDVDWVHVRSLAATTTGGLKTQSSALRLVPVTGAELKSGIPGSNYRSNARR